MEIKFKRLDPRAVAPVRAHKSDAGFDLVCTDIATEINECGQLILAYKTGLAVEIPEGYFGLLVPRSSIAKKAIMLTNHAGVIDSGYRGEIVGKFRSTTDVVPALYKVGERFAQLLILPCLDVTFEEALELSDSERGEGGFGSTGSNEPVNNDSAPTGSVESQNTVEVEAEQTATEAAAGDVKAPEQAQ